MNLFYVLVVLLVNIKPLFSAVCGDTTIGVADPPSSYIGTTDGTANTAYVLTDASVQFTCCGRIKTWKFYVTNTGTLKLQVWRAISGTTYKLVGENSFTIPASATNQQIEYEVAEEDRIQVVTNDFIGWYSTGTPMIPYSGPTNAAPDKTYYLTTSVSTGNSYTFTNYRDNRYYAIVAIVTANEEPYFDNIPSKIHVFDHLAISDVVLTLEPTDTTDDDITVSLHSADPHWTIDPITYEVVVTNSLSVTSSRTDGITPKITDSCSETTLPTLNIYVQNQKAVISSLPSSVEISETANAETLLHTVVAVDNEVLTCQLPTVLPTTTVFQVKETSAGSGVYGVYYVPVSTSGFDFDYDAVVRYDISVTCTDGRLTSEEGHLMVYIQKNIPPEFTNLPAEEVLPQQLTAAGTPIQVSVTDTDSTTLTYSIDCDPTGCPVTISTVGLVTTTVDLSTVQVPAYDVYVTVNDGHTSVGPMSLSIHISNINDIPEFANYELDANIGVEENTVIGTSIFTYYTTELDSPDIVTYSWTSAPSSGTNFFEIGTSTGEIRTTADMDFDTMADTNFVFTVEATDGKDTATTTLTISVVNVNEAPSFSGSNYIINDDENVGGTLLATASITATDPDAGDVLEYTLDCNGYNTTFFEMDNETAAVYFGRDFDTDIGHPPVTQCNVTVTDIAGLTDTQFLTINIDDTNDFTPSFELDVYTVFLFPNEAVGTILVNVSASDGDITETWSTIVFGMDQSALGDNYFNIDENGTISIAKDISAVFLYGQTVSITLTANDGGGLQGTSTLVLIFPETTTTSTTTTELPFRIESYADNGYWYSLAGVVVLMNIVVMLFLCYKYCDCCRSKNLGDNRTERQKKTDRIKAMNERKARARIKFLPADDPWSVNIHENYSKLEKDKIQEKARLQHKSSDREENKRSSASNQQDEVRQSKTSINSSNTDVRSSNGSSEGLFPNNQPYRQQNHHLYNPNTGRTISSNGGGKPSW